MNTLAHADAFFYVSAIGFCVLGALALVTLIFLVLILRDVAHIAKEMRVKADHLLAGADDIEEAIKEQWHRLSRFARFFTRFIK